MRISSLILLTQLFASAAFAQTIVSGAVFGNWTLAGSPYLVVGEIHVPPNADLNIETGVRVEFQGAYRFTVQGSIWVGGQPGETVFTQDTIAFPARWLGIRFASDSVRSMLRYVTFENCAGGDNGVVVTERALITFSECTFRDFVYSAFVIIDTEIDVNNCLFVRCGRIGGCGGAIRAHNITGTITARFEECASLDGGAVCLYNSTVSLGACIFERNRATLWGGAIYSDNCELLLTNCHFIDNAGLTGGVFSMHHSPNTEFRDCVFSGNTGNRDGMSGSYGVGYFLTGTSYSFENCVFENNTASNTSVIYSVPPCNFKECVFLDNPGSPLLSGTQIGVTYSDFWPQPTFQGFPNVIGIMDTVNQNGDSVDVYSNLVSAPDFVSLGEGMGPYYPNFDSPLIDAGDTTEIEWDGTHPEIGLREYLHFPIVDDLTLQRIGDSDNLQLQWSRVGSNCHYRIYRSLEDNWDWNSIELVGETPDSIWVDEGALNFAHDKAVYRIASYNCEFGR